MAAAAFLCLGASWPVRIESNMTSTTPPDDPQSESETKLAYSLAGFCRASTLGRTKVFEEIRCGRLKAKKVGSRTIITVESALEYMSELEEKES